MKIMFVCPYFYPKIGGLENYVYNIAKRLSLKHEIVVITSNHLNLKDKIEFFEGMKVIRLSKMFKISNTPINPFWYFKIKNFNS